jgi:hypothetical protein|tara:strand:+ start:1590 stop:1775 length:186 start_codon:yes stop_codon:yes gene_type:complete
MGTLIRLINGFYFFTSLLQQIAWSTPLLFVVLFESFTIALGNYCCLSLPPSVKTNCDYQMI